mmetsp:Transcript_21032/g.33855  ORF Transcript_21032/g.33855 Transcript_21032/m.33855 type:complete len:196 (+) Transcript_21032:82-669(+)
MSDSKTAGIMKDEEAGVSNADTQPGMAVVSGDEYVQHDAPKRRAHICCGCCCDTRKAVIVVNIISLCFGALGVMSVSMLANAKATSKYDDDAVQSALDDVDGVKIGLTLGALVLGMICSGVALFGAAKFNKIAIAIAGLWYVFEVVRSLAFRDPAGAFLAAGFCYPHAVFYYELKNGIMTPEKYPNEKVCCECCG